MVVFQVSFPGITGHVSFDDHGYRKNYTLDVMELGLNLAAEKVHVYVLLSYVLCYMF